MALRVVSMAELRLEILTEPELTGDSVTEVCRRRGISRQTFYEYRRRYEAAGLEGLRDRSSAPIESPNRIDPDLEELIRRMRKDHPRWGAVRIGVELVRAGIAPPATSTIHRVLQRNHLIAPQPRKKPKAFLKRFERPHPNDLWQMDATEITLLDGSIAYVIDILDDHARFFLAGVACQIPTADDVWACFERAARAYGLPRQVLTDNHITFTGRFRGVTVDFERKLASLKVRLINAAPSHPQTQGKIERQHLTLKEWIEDQGGAASIPHLQVLVDAYKHHYNSERPNQAIGNLTPAERYSRSTRSYRLPSQLRPSYPEGAIVRKVSRSGQVCYDRNSIQLSPSWAECSVMVIPKDGRLHVFFADELLREVPHFRQGGRHPLHKASRPLALKKGA